MKTVFIVIILLGLKLNLKAQNFTDSVKKYSEIGTFYYEYNKDELAFYYYDKVTYYQRKVDSISAAYNYKRKIEEYKLTKQSLETKYKIKLP